MGGPGPDLFRPDGARAREWAGRLRLRLAGSFEHLLEACAPHLKLDEAEIRRAVRAVRASGQVRPEIFIIHRQCVEAARDGQLETLAAVFDAFCKAPIAAPGGLVRRNWGDRSFSEAELARYQWVFGEEGDTRIAFAGVPETVFAEAGQALEGALGVLGRAEPELAAEIDAVVHEVVFAQGEVGTDMTFDGVTAFFAWGSLLLNAAEHRTVPGALSGLVHEAAHGLMFAASEGAPLVENDPEQRYPSPLRRDLRPMNGVFHATVVSARIAYAMDRALGAGVFGAEERAEAEGLRAGSRRAFEAGLGVVREHAKPTELGRALMAGAERCMAGAKALA